MSELVIKQAGATEAADVALLLTELNRTVGALGYDAEQEKLPENTDVTPGQVKARIQRAAGVETVLVGYMDGEPAGFTSLRLIPYLDQDTPYAEVTQMHVRPAFRRRGIASRLIAAAEERAAAAGATCVRLITGTDNQEAQTFYRKSGYMPANIEFAKYFATSGERRPVHA